MQGLPKIALLQCDQVADHLRSINGDYPQMFQNLLPSFDIEIFEVFRGAFPESAKAYEVYLVTGSKYSVYDALPWIDQLKSFVYSIYQARKKYIGICFGHQILAEALGGKVGKSGQGWCVGVHDFKIVHHKSWMQPVEDKIQVLMSCQDQVLELPVEAMVLGQGQDCKYGLFCIADQMLGIQGHPEFSKDYSRALMLERMERIGVEKTKKGLVSLETDLDIRFFDQWIQRFINQK